MLIELRARPPVQSRTGGLFCPNDTVENPSSDTFVSDDGLGVLTITEALARPS